MYVCMYVLPIGDGQSRRFSAVQDRPETSAGSLPQHPEPFSKPEKGKIIMYVCMFV